MKTVIVKSNQTIFDIAVENYGTVEAVGEIIRNNPGLTNEDSAKIAAGIDPITDKSFYIDLPVRTKTTILVDTDSRMIDNTVIKEIEADVTTYDLIF